MGSVAVGRGATDVAVARSRVWVANPTAGSVTAVDPATMRIARTVRVGGTPRSLAVDGETLWVAVAGEAPATRATAQGVEALPESTCEPVIAGADGRADVLIASDLPLQGGIRITALQMTQAITFVLRERRFRAGRLRVAYQSCDDPVARTGLFDEAKCAGNARSYAENADVVVVIGTLNSPCAVAALPELNRARGGPLAMISPLNSFVGLTRQAPASRLSSKACSTRPAGATTSASFRPTTSRALRSRCSRATAAATQSSSSTTASPAMAS